MSEVASASFDELKQKKPVRAELQIVLDGEVADRWAAAQNAVDAAKRRLEVATEEARPTALQAVVEAEDALEELRPEAAAITRKMVFQSIGRRKVEQLMTDHPATDAQQRQERRENNGDPKARLIYNPDTYPPALVAATLVEPKLTYEEAVELFESENITAAEWAQMFYTAQSLDLTSKVVSLGKD